MNEQEKPELENQEISLSAYGLTSSEWIENILKIRNTYVNLTKALKEIDVLLVSMPLGNYIREAIKSLIYSFLNSPTLYLEEKHLHNEFDRIIKLIIPKDKQIGSTIEGYPFPLLMNEYATVNRYKAKQDNENECGFQKIYNPDSNNTSNEIGSPGSLDYVFLHDSWLNENNILTCINKDEYLSSNSR